MNTHNFMAFYPAAERSFVRNSIGIHFAAKDYMGKYWYANPCEFEQVDEESIGSHKEPVIYLAMGDAQALMDELWRAGVRPTEQLNSMAAIEAVKYHLEDMRKLVFGKVEP